MLKYFISILILLPFFLFSCGVSSDTSEENDSEGSYITQSSFGALTGAVRDALTSEPLKDVYITLKSLSNSEIIYVAVTDSNGNYNFQNIPSGLYAIEFNRSGYLTASGIVSIDPSTTTTYPTLMQIEISHSGLGVLSGRVLDATTGETVSNVNIRICNGINSNSSCYQEISSDYNGFYNVSLMAGYYTFYLSKDGYEEAHYSLSIVGNYNNTKDFIISPHLNENEMRIILTWGESPSDLDSHLIKIENNQITYHVYYDNMYSSLDTNSCEAYLDVDDTSSFGPETITIRSLDPNGIYKYYVFDYSDRYYPNTTNLATSEAKVEVLWGNQRYVFYVPNGVGNMWKVFEIVNGNLIPCENNCIYSIEDSPSTFDDFRSIYYILNLDKEKF